MPWWGWYALGLLSGAVLGFIVPYAISLIALAQDSQRQY